VPAGSPNSTSFQLSDPPSGEGTVPVEVILQAEDLSRSVLEW